MAKPTASTSSTAMQFRVGPLSFSGLKFFIYSALILLIAFIAGSFSTPAIQGDSLGQMLISSQGITIILLALWAAFVREGLKNSPLAKKPHVVGICVLVFAAGQIAHKLIELHGLMG
jgi:hypothetical protein